jgi:predicted DCC family thiol-disulfide oxidoreductase YuxK
MGEITASAIDLESYGDHGSLGRMKIRRHVVIFDGQCVFCDGTMQFFWLYDTRRRLTYAPRQGLTAPKILARHPEISPALNSIVLVENYETAQERVWQKSEAVLRILGYLGGGWPLLTCFRLVPGIVRDSIYDWVARHRYRWFGEKIACSIPPPEQRASFLD